mgnify:CR=1 FL=1
MDTSASNRRLRTILMGIRDGTLVPRPEFQRRLVWTNKDKVLFVQTVLQGLPFPEIYIAAGKVDAKTGEGTEVLVDGQQRMTTLFQYFTDSKDLKLPLVLKPYSALPEAEQISFLEYKVVVRDLGALPLEQIKEVFQRINSASYGLNAMELHNARYAGAFKQLAEYVATNSTIESLAIFSANDIRRMNDVRYCSAMLALERKIDPDLQQLRTKLDEFYAQVDAANLNDKSDAGKYYSASLQASNDRSSRVLRGGFISEIIESSTS